MERVFIVHEAGYSGYPLCGSPDGRINVKGLVYEDEVTCPECIARVTPKVSEKRAI